MSKGKILLVGFGPGAPEHMSYRAREAIAEADVVIGYSTYIKLVKDQLEGKEVIRKGMTEEIDRCEEAYEQALQGKRVALISSGDIGVYGMAGPTFEVLLQAGWTPDSGIRVEVVPGTSALNACAALVGAPLTHDFCSISLSDLLTPWPAIARRLESAGRGDFVVALYNPKSGRRTGQIVEAQRILLRYRSPTTPVAIVKSAYRRRQQIQMTTLEAMADCEIGMLCTVLIGNRATFVREGLMITPRGYANKYESLTGGTKPGEEAGRSLSMGLTGWHHVVRRWLATSPEASLRQAAEQFDAPLGEILAALHESTPGDDAGGRLASPVDPALLPDLLEEAGEWGRLRAVVRSEAGAVAELMVEAGEFRRRGEWLNLVRDDFHLHIDLARLCRLWFFSHPGRWYGLHALDQAGHPLFSWGLIRSGERFDPERLAAFQRSVERHGQPFIPVPTDSEESAHE